MKIKQITKRLQAIHDEKPYKLPPAWWFMVALYSAYGPAVRCPNLPYFQISSANFYQFVALSKPEQKRFRKLHQAQINYCLEKIHQLDAEGG